MNDDRNSPATKGDILDLGTDPRAEFKSDISNLRDELVKAIRDSETEVVKAIYGYTQTIQARFVEQDAPDPMRKHRVDPIQSFISDLEKRLNIPPTAA